MPGIVVEGSFPFGAADEGDDLHGVITGA